MINQFNNYMKKEKIKFYPEFNKIMPGFYV
jgi:hypothetical protein